MSALKQLAGSFFWKPAGFVPSLDGWTASDGVLGKQDVTEQVAGPGPAQHRLLAVELGNGKVIGDLRLAATANDVVAGQLQSLFGCAEQRGHYLLRRRRFRLPKRHRGTALLLSTTTSDNYYHWLIDSLPRWKILQAAGWTNYDHVLLPGKTSPFQDELLDRLGVPRAKRLRCTKNFVHRFERLIVPAMPFPSEEVTEWASVWLRSLVPQKAAGPEKVYLRRGKGRRQIVNEAELETALNERGFVTVHPGTLTVAQQAEALSSARQVIAPHGAALTNLLFAPPGASVVEIFHPEYKNRCYVNLAAICGHHYAGLDGKPALQNGARPLDYTIDVAAVLRIISKNF